MNKYNPNIHHRKCIRLKGYDYAQAGLYFITICVQDRLCLFGDVLNGEMVLNDAGRMIEKWYRELENKYPDKKCHDRVVMPNHFHCIIENTDIVGADLRVCPINTNNKPFDAILSGDPSLGDPSLGDPSLGEPSLGEPSLGEPSLGEPSLGEPSLGEHIGSPLHRAVQWFKTMTTNEYIRGVKNSGWQPFHGKLWQRNYWEHIIRNESSYQRIAEYIINNPKNWNNDKLFNH